MAKIHDLKILPPYFEHVKKGEKTFELRFDDRDYCANDILLLREWSDGKYTGRSLTAKITYLLKGFDGLIDGWVILSIKKIGGKK